MCFGDRGVGQLVVSNARVLYMLMLPVLFGRIWRATQTQECCGSRIDTL